MADENIPEEWRAVEGWPYEVSDLGRVRRAADGLNGWGYVIFPKGRIVRPRPHPNGYRAVVLCGGGRKKAHLVHRLVCMAFHGIPPSAKHDAAHCDGDPANNRADNLRWVTRRENMKDMIRHNRTTRGARNSQAKLHEDDVRAIRMLLTTGLSLAAIGERFAVCAQLIHSIKHRKIWAWLD